MGRHRRPGRPCGSKNKKKRKRSRSSSSRSRSKSKSYSKSYSKSRKSCKKRKRRYRKRKSCSSRGRRGGCGPNKKPDFGEILGCKDKDELYLTKRGYLCCRDPAFRVFREQTKGFFKDALAAARYWEFVKTGNAPVQVSDFKPTGDLYEPSEKTRAILSDFQKIRDGFSGDTSFANKSFLGSPWPKDLRSKYKDLKASVGSGVMGKNTGSSVVGPTKEWWDSKRFSLGLEDRGMFPMNRPRGDEDLGIYPAGRPIPASALARNYRAALDEKGESPFALSSFSGHWGRSGNYGKYGKMRSRGCGM